MKVRIAKMIVMSAVLIPGHVTVMADIEVTAERIDPRMENMRVGVGASEGIVAKGDRFQMTTLREEISSTLGDRGFYVVENVYEEVRGPDMMDMMLKGWKEDLDVVVGIYAEYKPFDRTGNFYLFEGKATVRVLRRVDRRLLGMKRFSAKGQRKLGVEEAAESAAEILAKEISQWVGQNVSPSKLGIQEAVLLLKKIKDKELASTIRFLKSDPAIISVETVDPLKRRRCKLKLVYFEKNISEGIVNRMREITGKKVKRR